MGQGVGKNCVCKDAWGRVLGKIVCMHALNWLVFSGVMKETEVTSWVKNPHIYMKKQS
jgi:hypothetical protein